MRWKDINQHLNISKWKNLCSCMEELLLYKINYVTLDIWMQFQLGLRGLSRGIIDYDDLQFHVERTNTSEQPVKV